MEKYKLTVVTTTYNQEKYIEECIKGVIKQKTNFKFKFIISDDCSKDKTREIIEKYRLKYPDIIYPIYREKNLGPMDNFVNTLNEVHTEYVALCDGDDFWTDPNKLQMQVDFLDKNKDYNLCFHKVELFYEDKSKKSKIIPKKMQENPSFSKLLEDNFITANSVVYRWIYKEKDSLKNDFPKNIEPGDYYIHIMHASKGKIHFIDKVMSSYRKQNEGMWWMLGEPQLNVEHFVRHGEKMLNFYIEVENKLNLDTKTFYKSKKWIITQTAISYKKKRMYKELKTFYKKYHKNHKEMFNSIIKNGLLNIFRKNKKRILLFSSIFLIYFILGLTFTYYLKIHKYWNVLFDMDTPRVVGDLSIIEFNHYRTSVHPLFVIFFQPIIILMNLITKDSILSILLLQSFISTISLSIVYQIIKKIGLKSKLNTILTILFGFSFGQILFTSNIETYIFAQVLLLMLWLFVIFRLDKKLNFFDYIILVLLGIGSLGVTLTNFVQFIIALFILVFLNKNEKQRILKCISLIITVISISVLLANLQQIIWPSAPNFFTKNISDLLFGSSEEALYLNFDLNLHKFINIINANFSYSLNIFKLLVPETGVYVFFKSSIFINIISIILFLTFIILNISFILKTKFKISEHKFYYAMLAVYISNFILHLFYGNEIAFLYICHYNFSIILLFAYILNYFKKKDVKNKLIFRSLILFILLLSLKSVLELFIILFEIYNPIEYIRFLPILIIIIVSVVICLMLNRKKITRLILAIISVVLIMLAWKYINNLNIENICTDNCSEYEIYYEKYKNYEKQLKELKNSLSIRTYQDRESKIGVFYFGMADRNKMLYKDGKLIDIKSKKIIKEIDYKDELIIPNEYTVILRDDNNNIYKIIENEEGVFFYTNSTEEVLSKGKVINLPDFKDNKYSEILKVLHQEILFNIDGDIPKPNIFGYKNSYYRDAMLATMVLEKTNNTNLLESWVKNIDKIYDNSRNPNINEADNLGELLYIIGAVGVNRDDLIEKILKEINNIKNPDGSISGMVDGSIQKYYPTVLALYGAQKNNIKLDLIQPQQDDAYARLTWYYNNPISTNVTQESKYYPYINWGFYHYSNYGTLYILDEIYPLSYEGGNPEDEGKIESECFISEFYCEKNLYISHIWHAAEMFLFIDELN